MFVTQCFGKSLVTNSRESLAVGSLYLGSPLQQGLDVIAADSESLSIVSTFNSNSPLLYYHGGLFHHLSSPGGDLPALERRHSIRPGLCNESQTWTITGFELQLSAPHQRPHLDGQILRFSMSLSIQALWR